MPAQDPDSKRRYNTLWRRLKSTPIRDPESTIITLKNGVYRVDLRDSFLISREGGDPRALDLYYNLMTDPTVYTSNDRMTTLVYNMERKLRPGGVEKKDIACFEYIKEELANKKCAVRKAIDTMVLAQIMGVTWSEIVWFPQDGQISFDIVPADSRRLAFTLEVDERNRSERYVPRIKSDLNLYPGEPVPDNKFIIHTYYTVPIDSPYGLGIGQQIWWLVEFKKAAMQLWNQISSRHAGPMVVGKVPDNTKESTVDDFFSALEDMAQNATFLMQDDFEIEIMNADTDNADVLIKDLIEYCDNKIREVMLGESGGSSPAGLKPGLAGAAKDARAITLQKARRMSDDINDRLNNTLIKWLANKNFPGAKPPILITESQDSEQLDSFVNHALTLAQMGYEIDPAYIEKKTGYPQKPRKKGLGEDLGELPNAGIPQPGAEQEQSPEYLDSRTETDMNQRNQ